MIIGRVLMHNDLAQLFVLIKQRSIIMLRQLLKPVYLAVVSITSKGSVLFIRRDLSNRIKINSFQNDISRVEVVFEKITESFYSFSTNYFEGKYENEGTKISNGIEITTANNKIYYWYFEDEHSETLRNKCLKEYGSDSNFFYNIYVLIFNYLLILLELRAIQENEQYQEIVLSENRIVPYVNDSQSNTNSIFFPHISDFIVTAVKTIKTNLKLFWVNFLKRYSTLNDNRPNTFITYNYKRYFPRMGSIF